MKNKNIWLLPTDKPSRLILQTNGVLRLSEITFKGQIASGVTQNIYITSDEEIKESCWVMPIDCIPYKLINLDCILDSDKKIILTTDQDLIKDGIQAIDDEFLEWFVKNPSCEEVEVEIETTSIQLPQQQLSENSYDLAFRWINKKVYKIIIPKEEVLIQSSIDGEVIWGESKQETLQDKLKLLAEEWRKRQIRYQEVAQNCLDNQHNNRKFTYKSMATRDCWKELLELIEDEK